MHVKKIAVTQEKRIYPIDDLNRSISLNEGAVDRQILIDANHDGIIKTTTGHELLFCDANFKDNYDRMKRGPALIIPKDIGFVIAECALTKDSVVIDAGAGTGGSTCLLAGICKTVYSYDIEPKHLKVVRENCIRLDIDNVILEEGDVCSITAPEKVDLMLIDIPNPTNVLESAKRNLKQGGFLVLYTPHINQVQEVVKLLDDDFKFVSTIELIQRRWEVDNVRLRPKHAMLGHTAFLTFIRLFKR
ncbi:methyltransferase domain-containing protein [Candidatus Woesearchaeota archaeon]|nr:methyltransferase domain-containing protein [Candidatus Woesearchaeota archaeon]